MTPKGLSTRLPFGAEVFVRCVRAAFDMSHDGNPSVGKICTRMTKGWVVACDQLIEDVDKASGARFSRDGLDAMMAEIKKGRIDVSA